METAAIDNMVASCDRICNTINDMDEIFNAVVRRCEKLEAENADLRAKLKSLERI